MYKADLVVCGLLICEFIYLKLQIDHSSRIYLNLQSFFVFLLKFVICKPYFLVPIYRNLKSNNDGLTILVFLTTHIKFLWNTV